jgi:hypothetical protein
MGRISTAHSTYRTRAASAAIAKFFNQIDPIAQDLSNFKGETAFFISEGGPGDEIRHSAMYAQLSQYFAKVHITCDPRLYSLLERSFPDIEFIPVSRQRAAFRQQKLEDRESIKDPALSNILNDISASEASRAKVVCSVLDVLSHFRSNRQSFGDDGSRLIPTARSELRNIFDVDPSKLNVGIAWRGLLKGWDRSFQYLEPSNFASLSNIPNCHFWSLQAGASTDEVREFSLALPNSTIPKFIDLKDDFEAQSELISCLDLVISPMTTVGELSAMIGTETIFFVASHLSTWRRMGNGRDIWHARSAWIIHADPPHDYSQLTEMIKQFVQDRASNHLNIRSKSMLT